MQHRFYIEYEYKTKGGDWQASKGTQKASSREQAISEFTSDMKSRAGDRLDGFRVTKCQRMV